MLGQIMDELKVNRFGRTYRTGVALDQDMRTLIEFSRKVAIE